MVAESVGLKAGAAAASRRLSRWGRGSASRSRQTTSRPGASWVKALTMAADSWRLAEPSPEMLESMWRSFMDVASWLTFEVLYLSMQRRSDQGPGLRRIVALRER